jgi:hypothetical protein
MYKKMNNYLLKKRNNKEAFFLTLYSLFFLSLYITVIIYLLNYFGLFVPISDERGETLSYLLNNFYYGIFVLFASVIVEESIFRLPISFLAKSQMRFSAKINIVFLINIFFGLIHVFNFNFDWAIFPQIFAIQTIIGLFFSFIYAINGGIDGKKIQPLIIISVIHFIFNISLLLSV